MKERLAAWAATGAATVTAFVACFATYAYIAGTPGTPPPAWLDVVTFAGIAAFVLATPILALPALLWKRAPRWSRGLAVGLVALWTLALLLALVLPFLL